MPEPADDFELYNAGRERMNAGDYPKAIEYFRRSIERYPHFKTLELLGECLLAVGDPLAAIVPCAAAAGLGINEFKGFYLLAKSFLEIGDLKRAKQHVDRAIELRPDFKRARDLREEIVQQLPAEK